jgi:hypothetical protein
VQSEAEAEAYTGAFTARIIPIKTASMARISPKVVKGAATLTRTLRKHPSTRPLVKTVPTIVARTGQKLAQQAAQGKPITSTTAAQVMAGETKKVLSNPMTCAKAMVRSTEAAKKVAKPTPAKQSEYEYEGESEIERAIDSPLNKKRLDVPAPGYSRQEWQRLSNVEKRAAKEAARAAALGARAAKRRGDRELHELY